MWAVYCATSNANHKQNIIYFLLLVLGVITLIITSILPKPCCLEILKVKFDNQESSYVSVYDYFLHVSSCHNNIAILKGQSAFTLMKEKT